MNEDTELLRRYALEHSESAFAELIHRHVDLVYSAALRRAGGDTHRAEDVSQQVFSELARQARRLTNHPALAGWLYTTTRRMALHAHRTQHRWQTREQEAYAMNELFRHPASELEWNELRAVLDEAMHQLGEQDRLAVLLRYFQNKSLKEVGAALDLSDNAARMRVERALEKLRTQLARKGVTSTTAALVAIITGNVITAAPAAFVTTLTSVSLAGAAGSGTTLSLLKLMTATKLKIGVAGAIIVAGVLVVVFSQREDSHSTGRSDVVEADVSENQSEEIATHSSRSTPARDSARLQQDAALAPTPEEIVTGKLATFGRSRRELTDALARRQGIEVPDAVKRFFDAVESGNWDEIDARFKEINGGDSSSSHGADRPPGVNELWSPIIDAYGAAEQVHEWPAQKLLDYGNAILDSLRPGMVYVGGTDNGRWIPELLNDTSDGEQHVVITQNGLADGRYLEYVTELYADRLATLTAKELQSVYQNHIADAQKRREHDEQFPDEPKQLRPGEDIQIVDGKVRLSGAPAVMALNEKLLQAFMEKNPDLSFAAQESIPMKSTYADALPLGPLMELRARNDENVFTSERAAQSVDYWRTTAENILANSEAIGSTTTLKAYSHDINSTANLLAAHNFAAEAEQAYRLSTQLWPENADAATGLARVLASAGRAEEARRVLDDFSKAYPTQHTTIETARMTFLGTAPALVKPAK